MGLYVLKYQADQEEPMRAIGRMIDEWDAAGTPTEQRLAEALQKLAQAQEDRLRLQWRVHCQRAALRQDWQIVDMRMKSQVGHAARALVKTLLDRNRALQARLDLHLGGHR